MPYLRNGQWVETDQGVGIHVIERVLVTADGSRRLIHGAYTPQAGESIEREQWVHLVNPDGTTLTALPFERCSGVTNARASSIPYARRAHLTDEQLAVLGYR